MKCLYNPCGTETTRLRLESSPTHVMEWGPQPRLQSDWNLTLVMEQGLLLMKLRVKLANLVMEQGLPTTKSLKPVGNAVTVKEHV